MQGRMYICLTEGRVCTLANGDIVDKNNQVQPDPINEYISKHYENRVGIYNELAVAINKEFGTSLQAETIRGRIRRMRMNRTIPELQVKGKDEKAELSRDAKIEMERHRLLKMQADAQERAEILEEAKFQNLLSTINQAVRPLEANFIKLTNPTQYSVKDESAVLVLSDLHFGKKTKTYNMAIAQERFIKLIDNTLAILSERNKISPIKELHLFWTGDIVDGEQIYATHGSHIDDHVVNQIFKSLEIVAPQITRFVEAGYFVHNHFVRGNHGRVSKFHHEVTNWDYIYGLTLELMLKNVPNMTFNVTSNWNQVVNVRGKRILQWHGHQIKMTMNLPWYSLTTRISRWATCDELEDFDISVSGHFHSSSCINWNEKKVFTNGTMVSGDQFALEFIGLASTECQHLFGVNESGVTWKYEVGFGE